MKVLILDDDHARAEEWKREISSIVDDNVNIVVYDNDGVSRVISELHQKRLQAREGDYRTVSELDEIDLLIVDYDLLGLDTQGRSAWSTGAEVAYAARLMSKVGPIIVVNQYGTNSFDLTMRRASPSYADLDLGSKHVTSSELWSNAGFEGFRPWHWPNLKNEPSRFDELSEFVLGKLDFPVIQAVGLNVCDFESPRYISPELLARLGLRPDGDMTFRQLLTGFKRAGGRQQPNPISVFNILEKDAELVNNMPPEILARLGAAVLSHWIERLILPNQELIADAPHLASQYPWVVEAYERIESWEGLVNLEQVVGLLPGLEEYRVAPSCLISRPAYWAADVKQEVDVPEDFSVARVPNIAFCEDSSSFKDKEACTAFPSDLQTFDRERWVVENLSAGGEIVNYEPQAYLLM